MVSEGKHEMEKITKQLKEEQRQFIANNDAWIKSEKDITCPDTMSKETVYGMVDDGRSLVFIPRWNAFASAQFMEAIHLAGTWRELKMMLSKSGYRWVLEYMGRPASLDDDFEPEFMDDGNFPFFPPEHMRNWMPEDIFNRYVRFMDSFLNGMIPELPPESMTEIVAGLEAQGYTCVRDDKLVQAACGYNG